MTVVERELVADGVLVVRMNDPETYNSLTPALADGLLEVFADVRHSRDVGVVVLTGAGRGFCAGANMTGTGGQPPQAEGRGPVGSINAFQEYLMDMVLAIHESPKPVIAAVHGAAIGGGLALVQNCDLRVASDDAYFAAHFIRVGLSSCDLGTSYWLPRLVGPTMAAELMLTGRRVPAAEAKEIGLVNRVVAREDLVPTSVLLARQILENSEYGVRMTKVGMWANLDAPSLRHAMELENRTQVLGTFTGNMTEAGRAFRDKREPEWRPM